MKWITNMRDPNLVGPKVKLSKEEVEEWQRYHRLGFITSEPKATAYYTPAQLREMGMSGIYEPSYPIPWRVLPKED